MLILVSGLHSLCDYHQGRLHTQTVARAAPVKILGNEKILALICDQSVKNFSLGGGKSCRKTWGNAPDLRSIFGVIDATDYHPRRGGR
jgi:hypothetical protein